MKKLFLIIFIIALIKLPIFAKTNNHNMLNNNLNTSEKMDSINITPKGNSKELNKNDEPIKGNPLANKKYGIEVNIFRLLSSFDHFNFSGGFSLFDIDRDAEIVFPIYFYLDPGNDYIVRGLSLDCHYRLFLGNTQNGFYISGFVRYANIKGWIDVDNIYYEEKKLHTENKFGLGIGIGYRIFSYKGFYWGISLNVGRYILGNNNVFWGDIEEGSLDLGIIIIFDILKFGWAF